MIDQIESDKAKLICLYLSVERKATVDEIKSNLNMKCMEVYSVMKKLSEKEIVECTDTETYEIIDNRVSKVV